MRGFVLSAALAAICLPVCFAASADEINADDIIRKFAAKELEFQQARNNYTYRQTVNLTEVNGGGKWDLIEDIIFTPEGKRISKVVWAPVQSLQQIILTPDDERDLRDVQPFVLTTGEIPNYDIRYTGRDKVDEISCYTFSVKPKKLLKDKRYFEGQIWVDDRDLQIVKTFGKGVGIKKGDDAFPRFETYREQIDGKYWFPTYTRADDTLHFRESDVHIRMVVKYQDYKRYEGRSTIKFGGIVDDPNTPPAPPKK
jgi:hypothetical protein